MHPLQTERQRDLLHLREMVACKLAGRHVIEVACGTGYWTEILAGSARAITAVDINEGVLEIARGKPLAGSKAAFHRADGYALPEFPRRFDGALAAFWWSHILKAKLRSFLRGLHRLLTPDAFVMFLDNVYVESSSTPLSRRDADGNTYQQRLLNNGSSHEVLKNFPAEQELRETVDGLASGGVRRISSVLLDPHLRSRVWLRLF